MSNFFFRLQIFLHMNVWGLKHYLRLYIAPQSQVLLQAVMVYNVIIWFIFLLRTRENFHRYLTGSPLQHLDFSQEFRAFFGTYNRYDAGYLTHRHLYRLYLGFLFILILATILFFLPSTWQLAFGFFLYRLLASLFAPAIQAYGP